MPEFIVVATAFVVLFADLVVGKERKTVLAPIALAGLGVAAVTVISMMPHAGVTIGGRFSVDAVAWWFKLLFIGAAAMTVTMSMDTLDGRAAVPAGLGSRGEYYTIMLLTVSGMMFLASATDLITLYVGLELATIPLFVLTAWKKDALSGEAGLKYVIMGALASALLIYGLGILYGLTAHTDFVGIAGALKASPDAPPAFWLAVALITAAVGFKMTIVPFHMWAAEVYQGAPTPVTAFISVASKSAGLLLIFQLFFRVMGKFMGDLTLMFALLAAATMTLGNVVAIVQNNIKRFMAFSAVSQAGYVLMGFLSPEGGVPAMLYYMLVYMFTNMAVFSVIVLHTNATGLEDIKDYRGLSRTNPGVAFAMMIALFGLAGIPPLSGFVGKFFLFSIASKAGFHWLVALAAVNSTISLYYYLRIIRQMYIEPVAEDQKPLATTPVLNATIFVTAVASGLLGIIPFFYETINAQTANWFTLLLAQVR
jgi:NADH-quinone oxidoreductase subunit N